MFIERRDSERDDIELEGSYQVKEMFKTEEFPCFVTDVSKEGIGIQCEVDSGPFGTHPKGGLKTGHAVLLKVKDLALSCKVVYVETSGVGLKFDHVEDADIEKLEKYARAE